MTVALPGETTVTVSPLPDTLAVAMPGAELLAEYAYILSPTIKASPLKLGFILHLSSFPLALVGECPIMGVVRRNRRVIFYLLLR